MGYTCSTFSTHLQSNRSCNVRTREQNALTAYYKVVNRNHRRSRLSAAPRPRASLGEESTDDQTEIERQKLMKLIESPIMSGSELRQLVFEKFNREYDCRLMRKGKRMYFQIFWKFLGQRSFPLTEEEYQFQLDAGKDMIDLLGIL